MFLRVFEMKSEYQKLMDKLPEDIQVPEFEFDSINCTFIDLNNGDVISLKCNDQNGNILNPNRVINGISYYYTMRLVSVLYPDSEAAREFLKTHPSCNRN